MHSEPIWREVRKCLPKSLCDHYAVLNSDLLNSKSNLFICTEVVNLMKFPQAVCKESTCQQTF